MGGFVVKNEIIIFENQNVKLEVNMKDETVWLNREQMAKLFDRDVKTIGKHINEVEYYNLDMILSVGYRVKSKNGIIFRKWANQVLKDYLIKGML